MSIPCPRCGNDVPHPPHPAATAESSAPDCPGWTARQQLVRHLVTSVNEYVREHYVLSGPAFRRPLPEGLRLEMHPSVRHVLMADPDLWERPSEWGADWFPVPVKITTDLPRDGWRLVIVTEEVLLGGKMPGS